MLTDDIRSRWDYRIDSITKNHWHKLNHWEQDFMDSIGLERQRDRDLTSTQVFKLYKIYNRVIN